MRIHEIPQGDLEWLKLRVGKVTASELNNLLTPAFKPRDGEMPKTYLYSKVAEAWRGEPLPGFSSHSTEQGQLLEDEARREFAFDTEHKVRNVGFVETDDGTFGCSPDALLDEDGGLELKCPEPTNHVRYLLNGELPPQYACQVHGSMFATGRPWWKFVSYRRGFPTFTIRVERDERICRAIEEVVSDFAAKLTAALEQLKQANQ